jgi:hypothetical protein
LNRPKKACAGDENNGCGCTGEVTCGKLLSSPPKRLILCKLNKAIQK